MQRKRDSLVADILQKEQLEESVPLHRGNWKERKN